MSQTRSFPARKPGTCIVCNLRFHTTDRIRWARMPGAKGLTWHDSCDQPDMAQHIARALVSGEATVNPPHPVTTNPASVTAQPIAPTPVPVPMPVSVTPPPFVNGHADPMTSRPEVNGLFALLADSIAPYLDTKLKGLTDEAKVREICTALVAEALTTLPTSSAPSNVTTVQIVNPDTHEVTYLGAQHRLFPLLLKCLQARTLGRDARRLNVWLTGPTGSGKTTSAKLAAEALGLPFGFCGALDSEYKLLGFINAAGVVVNTEFKRFFTEGGVFLLDEVDSWLPSALLALNAALANGECAFPEGTLKRHADFVCIAAANTWGLGATADYVGRAKLDAAFLARFACKLDWAYDEDLERALCPAEYLFWAERIIALRTAAKRQGLKVIIHPRYTYEGASLIAAGLDQATVESITVAAGLSAQDWANIR